MWVFVGCVVVFLLGMFRELVLSVVVGGSVDVMAMEFY